MATSSANMSMDCKTESGFRKRRVCIIGAGMSGLVATKYLLNLNMNPVVFEVKPGIGGVWRETFGCTRVQTLRHEYQFTDFPWPSHVTNQFPTHYEVLDYFQSYAMHFGLLDHIHFNTKVVEIRYIGHEYCESSLEHAGLWSKNGGPYAHSVVWDVGVHKVNGESIEWHRFDFLVLCIGKYGDLPHIPSFPPNKGPEVFQGKVLHTMDYARLDEKSAYELIKGKSIVVIGCQKSALDFAVECAEANQEKDDHPCTVVFRRAHWALISFELYGFPIQLFYNTRFAQFLLERPAQGFLHGVLSRLFRPLRWAIFKFFELYLCRNLPLRKYGLVPDQSFVEELSACTVSVYHGDLFSRADEGSILFRKSPNWSFSSKGVVLDDGAEVEADLVVFATGFDAEKKLKNLLPGPFAGVLEDSTGIIPLYRGLIHPHIPHMAILGYSESLSNLYSSEMRSRWLSHFLSGKFVLPSMKEMLTDIDNHYKHWKRISPFYWKSCHGAFHIWDNDNLCRDMGWNPMRKKNWFFELFAPYSNLDYSEM